MAKILSMVLCENIQPVIYQNSEGNREIRPNIISPLNIIEPVAIPGNYSFCIFFTVGDVDKTSQNKMQIGIIAPNKETVFSTGVLDIDIESVVHNNVTFSLDLRNFVFLQEGFYSINVTFNGEKIFNWDFEVKKKVDL